MNEPDTETALERLPVYRHALKSLVCSGIFAVALCAITWVWNGRGIAERAATSLAMPIGIVWLIVFAIGCWCVFQKRRMGTLIVFAIWMLVTVTHNRHFAQWIFQFVEHPYVKVDDDHAPFRTVIVLGGGAGVDPEGEPQLGGDGQRLVYAGKLWHQKRTQSVICTGTSPLHPDPSDIGKRLLVSLGVDPNQVFEVPGDNTSQEMRGIKGFFENLPEGFPADGEVGLITSAYHMPRAIRLSKGEGLELVALPCGFRVKGNAPFSPWYLIPTSGAATTVGAATKEMLAALIGR